MTPFLWRLIGFLMFNFLAVNETESLQYKALRQHIQLYFDLMIVCKHYPDSTREKVNGITRSISGSLTSFNNIILDWEPQKNWDERIVEQLSFFASRQIPFTWPVDEGLHKDLRDALIRNGFKSDWSLGSLAGVLDNQITSVEIPQGYRIERVIDDASYRVFTSLAFKTFEIEKNSEDEFFQFYQQPIWNHWMIRDSNDVVVSIGSSLIQDASVSFWNAATDPAHRHLGLNTAIAKTALLDARNKGCQVWVAFLAEDRMAQGFLTKLGGRQLRSVDIYTSPPL